MKRFIFAHFIAFFCLCTSAQTSLGWGSIDVRYSKSEMPAQTSSLVIKSGSESDEGNQNLQSESP